MLLQLPQSGKPMTAPSKTPPPALWIHEAFQDYSAARCLLLNGHFRGFVLAQQGVEKMLKAYLRQAYPDRVKFVGRGGLKPGVLPLPASHDLVAHAVLVQQAFPESGLRATGEYRWLLEELSYQYHEKYPDNDARMQGSTTEWLNAIDALMVQLSFAAPIGEDDRWRIGVFSVAWPLVLRDQPDPPWRSWVRTRNAAFDAYFDRIQSVIESGYARSSPDKA